MKDVRTELERLADPHRAESLQRFFKTGPGEYGEGDRFLGIRVPQLRSLARRCRAMAPGPVLELLHSPWHEERLLALLVLVDQYRRGSDRERDAIHTLYLANTDHINSWDLVDVSAEHIVGAHLDPDQLGTLVRLARSDSVWERRIAIISTFHWIKRGSFEPTLRVASLLRNDGHDLIQKAVGWMLREIGKRDREREEAFLDRYHQEMPRTMLRYALEHFPDARRRHYLNRQA